MAVSKEYAALLAEYTELQDLINPSLDTSYEERRIRMRLYPVKLLQQGDIFTACCNVGAIADAQSDVPEAYAKMHKAVVGAQILGESGIFEKLGITQDAVGTALAQNPDYEKYYAFIKTNSANIRD